MVVLRSLQSSPRVTGSGPLFGCSLGRAYMVLGPDLEKSTSPNHAETTGPTNRAEMISYPPPFTGVPTLPTMVGGRPTTSERLCTLLTVLASICSVWSGQRNTS